MSFANKVVIVTGASSGIGAATGEAFAAAGGAVVLVARSRDKLSAVAERCRRVLPTPHAPPPLVIVADVADDEQARSVIQQTIDKHGKIDVLVNNAGTLRFCNILKDNLLETYDRVMSTNLRAVVHLTNLAAPHLVATKGNIVNVSSSISTKAVPWFSLYGASKAGVDHFTRSTALELAPLGVRANAVSPGPVDTDIFLNSGQAVPFAGAPSPPLGRVGRPDEIAQLILFLAGDKATAITGSNYVSDNGMNLL